MCMAFLGVISPQPNVIQGGLNIENPKTWDHLMAYVPLAPTENRSTGFAKGVIPHSGSGDGPQGHATQA